MKETEYLAKLRDQYMKSGYRVVEEPFNGQLPDTFADSNIRMLAIKGGETVAVRVKRQDEITDLDELRRFAEQVEKTPGWSLDFVSVPRNGTLDVPATAAELNARQIELVIKEAEDGLSAGLRRSAFLMAWTAVEASMRELARRSDLLTERESPTLVLETLYTYGLVSREDYEQIRDHYALRSALIHGVETKPIAAADVRNLIEFVGRLKEAEVEEAVA